MFDLNGKKVLVIGLARTGVCDDPSFVRATKRSSPAVDTRPRIRSRGNRRQTSRCEDFSSTRRLPLKKFLMVRILVIPSPGVPADSANSKSGARQQHSRLERDRTCRPLSSTAASLASLAPTEKNHDHFSHRTYSENSGFSTLLAGNIGTPLIDGRRANHRSNHYRRGTKQLPARINRNLPFQNISIFLNLTPDHLDRHGSMEAYDPRPRPAFSKNNCRRFFAILNADDSRQHAVRANEAESFLV